MVDRISSTSPANLPAGKLPLHARTNGEEQRSQRARDVVSLGRGEKPGPSAAMKMVEERAYEKLRSVVDSARKELGLAEGATLDTSPEATAGRIADFALGFFSKYAENNGLSNDEDGRRAYVGFIGKAVQKGIDEARGILGALNALNPQISGGIDKTAELIQKRFEDFIANG
jgi:hypothetical protein